MEKRPLRGRRAERTIGGIVGRVQNTTPGRKARLGPGKAALPVAGTVFPLRNTGVRAVFDWVAVAIVIYNHHSATSVLQ